LKVPLRLSRPSAVTLLSKGTQNDVSAAPSPCIWAAPTICPLTGGWSFLSAPESRQTFLATRSGGGAADGSFRTVLALADGSLMLEDAKTALGVVEPLLRFGSSALGRYGRARCP